MESKSQFRKPDEPKTTAGSQNKTTTSQIELAIYWDRTYPKDGPGNKAAVGKSVAKKMDGVGVGVQSTPDTVDVQVQTMKGGYGNPNNPNCRGLCSVTTLTQPMSRPKTCNSSNYGRIRSRSCNKGDKRASSEYKMKYRNPTLTAASECRILKDKILRRCFQKQSIF